MSAKKINILYIIDILRNVGGTERHLAHLVSNLPKDAFNCSVVTFDLGTNILVDQIQCAGVPINHIPVGREYTPLALKGALALSGIIKADDIDIVQTYHQKSDTFGAMVAKFSNVRHIISSKRDMGQNRKSWHVLLNKVLRNLFEKVIVVADAVGEMIEGKEKVPRSRIVRIYNGVDTMVFSPPTAQQKIDERTRLGFDPDDFVIGMVANFREEKNHDIFFEGAVKALEIIPSLKVIAVGGGPLLEKFRSLYDREPYGGKILLTGPDTDVSRYLRAMDVACLIPGKNEGFSNSVLEKMATGLPLIVTDVGGNAEAVLDRENGLVIEPDNVGSFVNALVALYDDAQMRLRMGCKSRELAEQKFSLEVMCKNHEALYLSLVSEERQID